MANLLTAKSKIILYTSKTLKDGSHPVVLRITYDRKRKYYTLGITGLPDRWNRDAGRFKGNNKNNKKLNKFDSKASDVLDDLIRENIEFTFPKFEQRYFNKSKSVTVFQFFDQLISDLEKREKYGNQRVYKDCLNAIKRFIGNVDFFLAGN